MRRVQRVLLDLGVELSDDLTFLDDIADIDEPLDHPLVELVFTMPDDWKLRGTTTKHVLREAMQGILPEEVIWRGKAGFGAPIRNWLRGDLKPMVEDLLSPQSLRNRGFFEPSAIRKLIDENGSGRADHAYRIWALMTFERWCRIFMDGQTP